MRAALSDILTTLFSQLLEPEALGECMVLLLVAILWALEAYLVQESLFQRKRPLSLRPGAYRCIRLSINLLASIALLAVCPVALLLLIFVSHGLLSAVIVAYQRYFDKPLVLVPALRSIREGVKASPFALRILPPKWWSILLFGLVAKSGLVLACGCHRVLGEPLMGVIAAGSLLGIVLILVLLQGTHFRFRYTQKVAFSQVLFAYGYLIGWLADFWMAPRGAAVLREATLRQNESPDRLGDLEMVSGKPRHVVISQLESLDWSVLNHCIDGKEVTPCLNRIANSGSALRVTAYHTNGSADMDYAVLSGGLPSELVNTYAIHGMEYGRSLPRFFQQAGYHTVALHGASGSFFNRRSNFERMGWDEVHFDEEFGDTVDRSHWGVRDRSLFEVSSGKLRDAEHPQFHFLITLDSHGPFNLIRNEEKEIFRYSSDWRENYFNSMFRLDENLERYLSSLPDNTLWIGYGDHCSGVEYGDFESAKSGDSEYVPCLWLQTGQEGEMGLGGVGGGKGGQDLEILDVINCLRRSIGPSVG